MNQRSQFTNDLADELMLRQLLKLQDNCIIDDNGDSIPALAASMASLSKDSVSILRLKNRILLLDKLTGLISLSLLLDLVLDLNLNQNAYDSVILVVA